MGSIYASAAQVYVWLGISRPTGDWLFDMLDSQNTRHVTLSYGVFGCCRQLQIAGKNSN